MKKFTFLFLLASIFAFAQQQTVTYSVAPAAFEETQSITITVFGSSINESTWGVTGNALYMWAWSLDQNYANTQDAPSNGSWTSSNESAKFTYNAGSDTYTKVITPTTYFNRTNIGRIGFLIKAKNGDGNKKSQDILINVGLFQVNLTAPAQNSNTILASGGSLQITATNTGGPATYNLISNGVTINTATNVSSYSYNHTNITNTQNYTLKVTQGTSEIIRKFTAIVNPGNVTQAIPAGLVDGINYSADNNKATLVLTAPGKDYVFVAGSFNSWEPTSQYAMKKDGATGKFWLELTGLTPQTNYTYQYWVVDETPVANSPKLVKTADPFSTLVLSPFDDPYIPATTYPNLPPYPAGQEREVTVLQTGQTPYNWQVTNFVKPKKEDLIIYEALVRDFDSDRNYQDLIDKIDYFKNLGINALQLMPVMEFEGNESWGYNTSFHLANDKFYGPASKLKELIDLCHQNGIAVILDVALNHAFGRNPMNRMWMLDPDNDGWGDPSSENPYFNQNARHSYNVGSDFNHSSALTKEYSKRVIKHWIEEYRIDGFRWDLTKGFTQNCPFTGNQSAQDACTENYQADRVAILKEYADYSWSLDANHYVIFEHLGNGGSGNEETEWANYRFNEGKGIMFWGNLNNAYNQLTMGYATNTDINRVGHVSRGFSGKRLIGYAESHDEERLMYKNLQFGVATNPAHNVTNLNVALSRMPALGAVFIPVPGPKMLWHFGELGWEKSIFTCNNGTVNTPTDATAGDCKLDTKPQPQWAENWLVLPQRKKIYDDWARMIRLKKEKLAFQGDYAINGNTLLPRIYVYNNSLPSSELKNVVILANFNVTAQNIVPDFPYTGAWYNLMDDSPYPVTSTNAPINLQPGEYRIYGNMPAALGTANFDAETAALYPNPATDVFAISIATKAVEVYSVTGQVVKSFKGGEALTVFNVNDLTPGIYLVKITDSNNRQSSKKLIKK
ncbi:T9SS type A sorting domain-containing protein [Flavobacterium sp. J372]|uniref:alpha-amylase family glycosyl hydrolase n=1 Tax=Flavobacterium sp. J372 TaxID=2898436 RepID=UPI002151F06F|nr:alpha-amylase family glycosyl hydrolase [Flavobacterium sp. J372]MCR5860849.1 T9SS type A sorting domain-containing protein [Flavobacterium sp. J372]